MSNIFSWSPFSSSRPSPPTSTIELRYGKQTIRLSFPTQELALTGVTHVKGLARERAMLDDDVDIKLLFQGRKMDDKDDLAKYGVRDGSRILMTASKKILKPVTVETTSDQLNGRTAPAASGVVAPVTALEKISALRQSVKNSYGAQVRTFVHDPPSTQKERMELKARLSELLLQQLLKFDDVIIDPNEFGSNEARMERKAAVKWIQGLMADIDKVDVNTVQ
jgi:BAG domain